MIVSGGQKNDSAIHIHVPILPQTSLRWTILKADRVESHELGPWGRCTSAAPPGVWRHPKEKTDSEQARGEADTGREGNEHISATLPAGEAPEAGPASALSVLSASASQSLKHRLQNSMSM